MFKTKRILERSKASKDSMFDDVKATFEKKKQCNSKALGIVTTFSDGTISEVTLTESLQFINQEHYQDITEERAINALCGYPLCSNDLSNVPTKQYHISTTHNKVFDITDRKNFCSNLCYKASKFLKDQIPTSPLWLRDSQPSTVFKFISLQSKGGIVGDEIDFGLTSIKADPNDSVSTVDTKFSIKDDQSADLEVRCQINNSETALFYSKRNSFNDEVSGGQDDNKITPTSELAGIDNPNITRSLCEIDPSHKHLKNAEIYDQKPKLTVSATISDFSSDSNTGLTVSNKSSINSGNDKQLANLDKDIATIPTTTMKGSEPSMLESPKFISKPLNNSSKRKSSKGVQNQSSAMENIVFKIERVLNEWFSISSLCFIFGEEKVKEILAEKKRYISEKQTEEGGTMDTHIYERYLALCRKLNILELEDLKKDASYKEEVKKPVPDYEALKEEAKKLDLKIKMFYKGDKVQFEEPINGAIKSESHESVQEPVLPLVDLHAQNALRRRIVFDKIRKVLQDLTKSLSLRGFDLNEEMRTFISTFTLSAHNITMKPAEWNLIAIALIKLLSVKDKSLEQALQYKATNKHLTLLLMSYSLDVAYLDRLVVWLSDVESLLRKND